MRSLPITSVRRFPRRVVAIAGTGEDPDRLRNLERIVEDVRRSIRELDESAGGDVRDRVEVVSRGKGVEISVPHKMKAAPTDYRILSQFGGDGALRAARSSLADRRFAYFSTTADKGVTFKVEFLVLEASGNVRVTPEPTYISDEDAQATAIGE